MRWLESLTPASRLKRDSARSPTCPTTESAAAIATSCQTGMLTPTMGNTPSAKSGATTRLPTTPAMVPDLVFPGLTVGASFAPPKVRPPNMAAVSPTQVTTRGKNTSQAPAQERSGYRACRMASRKTGSAPV